MRVISFKADEDLVIALEELARRKGIPKSEIIRRAIKQYLQQGQEKPFMTRRIRVY